MFLEHLIQVHKTLVGVDMSNNEMRAGEVLEENTGGAEVF